MGHSSSDRESRPPGGAGALELPVTVLLGLHGVIPVCLVIVLLDRLALGGAVAELLPAHPDALIGFTLLFNVPHIIASELILFDGEYARRYGRVVLLVVGATFLASLTIPFFVTPRSQRALVLGITLVHVVGQQVGLAGMLGRLSGSILFVLWRWTFTGLALMIYSRWTPGVGAYFVPREDLSMVVWIGVAFVTGLVALLDRRVGTRDGRIYLWSTHAILVALAGLSDLGYPCLALLVPRFVHDLTAWAFYVVHDVNRNRDRRRNLLYRVVSFAGVPVWIAGPVLALGLAALLRNDWGVHVPLAGLVVGTLSMVHYVLEALTWRRAGAYRPWVPVRRVATGG